MTKRCEGRGCFSLEVKAEQSSRVLCQHPGKQEGGHKNLPSRNSHSRASAGEASTTRQSQATLSPSHRSPSPGTILLPSAHCRAASILGGGAGGGPAVQEPSCTPRGAHSEVILSLKTISGSLVSSELQTPQLKQMAPKKT